MWRSCARSVATAWWSFCATANRQFKAELRPPRIWFVSRCECFEFFYVPGVLHALAIGGGADEYGRQRSVVRLLWQRRLLRLLVGRRFHAVQKRPHAVYLRLVPRAHDAFPARKVSGQRVRRQVVRVCGHGSTLRRRRDARLAFQCRVWSHSTHRRFSWPWGGSSVRVAELNLLAVAMGGGGDDGGDGGPDEVSLLVDAITVSHRASRGRVGEGFNSMFARLMRAATSCFGDAFGATVRAVADRFGANVDERAKQAVASEIVGALHVCRSIRALTLPFAAGLGRGCRFWPATERTAVRQWCGAAIATAMRNGYADSASEWCAVAFPFALSPHKVDRRHAVYFIASRRDWRRVTWLIKSLPLDMDAVSEQALFFFVGHSCLELKKKGGAMLSGNVSAHSRTLEALQMLIHCLGWRGTVWICYWFEIIFLSFSVSFFGCFDNDCQRHARRRSSVVKVRASASKNSFSGSRFEANPDVICWLIRVVAAAIRSRAVFPSYATAFSPLVDGADRDIDTFLKHCVEKSESANSNNNSSSEVPSAPSLSSSSLAVVTTSADIDSIEQRLARGCREVLLLCLTQVCGKPTCGVFRLIRWAADIRTHLPMLLPALLSAQRDVDRERAAVARNVAAMAAQCPFSVCWPGSSVVFSTICCCSRCCWNQCWMRTEKYYGCNPPTVNWRGNRDVPFCQCCNWQVWQKKPLYTLCHCNSRLLAFNHRLSASIALRDSVLDIALEGLLDKRVEVRETASVCLASVLRGDLPSESHEQQPEKFATALGYDATSLRKHFEVMAATAVPIWHARRARLLAPFAGCEKDWWNRRRFAHETCRSVGIGINDGFFTVIFVGNKAKPFLMHIFLRTVMIFQIGY